MRWKKLLVITVKGILILFCREKKHVYFMRVQAEIVKMLGLYVVYQAFQRKINFNRPSVRQGGRMKPKNPPKVIWLQIGEDCDCHEIKDWRDHDITWCVDKIFDNDIRYVLDKRQQARERG